MNEMQIQDALKQLENKIQEGVRQLVIASPGMQNLLGQQEALRGMISGPQNGSVEDVAMAETIEVGAE